MRQKYKAKGKGNLLKTSKSWGLRILVLAFFVNMSVDGNASGLSKQAEISLITCAPGNEAYSVYGHSAIRVKDLAYNYDIVFNYGIFDFNAPNFLYRFASGQTDYLLGAYKFEYFIREYKKDKRSVFEQTLNLTPSEKQKIFDFLLWNSRPENKVYRYNFFFDNCATRVRDVIVQQVDGGVSFPPSSDEPKTLKQLVKDYHGKLLWLDFGIDFIVSAPSDRIATDWEEMFLPDYLMEHFSNATKTSNGEPMVKRTQTIYNAPLLNLNQSKLWSPFVLFFILTVLVLFVSFKQFRKNRLNNWLDYAVYGVNGLIGVIVLWFTLYSEHPAMNPNYNLLWAIPIHLVFVIVWRIKKWRPITRYYHLLVSAWLILFFVFSPFIPQTFNMVFYLLIVMVLIRAVFHSINIFKETVNN